MMNPVTRNSITKTQLRYCLLLHLSCWLLPVFGGHLLANHLPIETFIPTPMIIGDEVVCPGSEVTYTTTDNPGNTYFWTLNSGGTILQQNGPSALIRWDLVGGGSGPHLLMVTETETGGPSVTDTLQVFIQNTSFVCEDTLNVTLDVNGQAIITPQMLLVGNFPSFDGFTVNLTDQFGNLIGNTADCSYIGQPLIASVSGTCDGNSCWTMVVVEDKRGPTFDCPVNPIEINCEINFNTYPPPAFSDNCDPDPLLLFLGEDVDDSNICSGVAVVKHWRAVDNFGNASLCDQKFLITTGMIDLPKDTLWTCEQYGAFPNITNPTDFTGIMSTSGSGAPSGASGLYCTFNINYHDDTLSTCGNSFTILRTWKVWNACTAQEITLDSEGDDNEQIIQVVDIQGPTIIRPPITLTATHQGTLPVFCSSTGLLPPAILSDSCNQVVNSRIFTPAGEAEYVNGIDASEGGYIPSPGLIIGIHIVTYVAEDACGNITKKAVMVTVVDDRPPVAVCDLETDVSLNSNGIAVVAAETFDDGSTDNCCIGHFEVKRMGQADSFFGPSVTFDCEDSIATVVMRVFDCFGNFNDCMVLAFIHDKENPTCLAPADISIACTDLPAGLDISDNQLMTSLFGSALASDNCSAEITELSATSTINNCGTGIITRNFIAMDGGNNFSTSCQQKITVTAHSDWTILFPPNWEGNCGEEENADSIQIIQNGCDLIAVNVSDQLFPLSNDTACFKIVRTYDIINWCTHALGEAPIAIATQEFGTTIDHTTFSNFGHYTYQQILKVLDNTPPTIIFSGENQICSFDADCSLGAVSLPIEIQNECSSNFTIDYSIDLNTDGTDDLVGEGEFSGDLPLGNHSITYLVKDGCGNQATKTVSFSVVDCKKPTPICFVLVVELGQGGTVDVPAKDYDGGSFDNCSSDLSFSYSTDPSDSIRTYDCLDLGQQAVQLWVTDANGNQDFCETTLLVQSNMWDCSAGDAPSIAGLIENENGNPVEDVAVQLNGASINSMTTAADGAFEFSGLVLGNDYTISPSRQGNPLNGVTTFDLVLITRQILGIETLDSPYKLIAADANNSKTITTLDLVELRKMILLINNEFTNNSSWRFIDKNYVFPNPQNPWEEALPEVIDLNNLAGDALETDFTAIKIGDVNGNALPGNLQGSSERTSNGTLLIELENTELKAGENYTIDFKSMDFENISGFQFTLEFDDNLLDFQEVIPGELARKENFGFSLLNRGILTTSWNQYQPTTLENGIVLFSLSFRALKDARLNEVLRITSQFTAAEAYQLEKGAATSPAPYQLLDVGLDFSSANDGSTAFKLYQNVPNPFEESTRISFLLPKAGMANLTVFDVSGKVLKIVQNDFEEGYNEVILHRSELPAEGVFYYQLKSPFGNATRKMIVIR